MQTTTFFTLHNTAPQADYNEGEAIEQKRNMGVIQNAGMLFSDAGFGEMQRVKIAPIVRWHEDTDWLL